MEEKSIEEKLYFQDYPVNDYKDDYVGFEEEVRMIEEGIESDCKILGLISEYGSGKSSIIELLILSCKRFRLSCSLDLSFSWWKRWKVAVAKRPDFTERPA